MDSEHRSAHAGRGAARARSRWAGGTNTSAGAGAVRSSQQPTGERLRHGGGASGEAAAIAGQQSSPLKLSAALAPA